MVTPQPNEQLLPTGDTPFHVEQHGIDFIPDDERWATPRDIGGMWAGVSLNIQYFIYGALLIGFGFNFPTTLSLILIGNASYVLLGVASLQGPQTGTTVFMISRASFGVRGSRLMSFFNWVTQLGFETEGLILIVGGAVVLTEMAGVHPSSTLKVIYIVVAAVVMMIVPYLGHATMVKVLRSLIVPFIVAYAGLAIFMAPHLHLALAASPYAHWELYTAGLAFTFALSGLGWSQCGNDYSRYVPRDASPRAVVGWVFLGAAVPQIIMMVLGAAAFTAFGSASVWNGANPFEVLSTLGAGHQTIIPAWFVVTFILLAIVQLFGINALDLYSSGVTLQSLGLRLKRYQAVVLDGVLAGLLTIWATFGSTFSLYMKEFVGVIIVWIAPWFGIFITDWFLRRRHYDAVALQSNDSRGLYYGQQGFNWSAIAALLAGMTAALVAFSKAPPPVNFPFHWLTPVSNDFGAACATYAQHPCTSGWFGGADFSVPAGILVGGLVYFVLERSSRPTQRQLSITTLLVRSRIAAAFYALGAVVLVAGLFVGSESQSAWRHGLGVVVITFFLALALVHAAWQTAIVGDARVRDRTTALALGTIIWAYLVYGIFGQAGHGTGLVPWVLGAGGFNALLGRFAYPLGEAPLSPASPRA